MRLWVGVVALVTLFFFSNAQMAAAAGGAPSDIGRPMDGTCQQQHHHHHGGGLFGFMDSIGHAVGGTWNSFTHHAGSFFKGVAIGLGAALLVTAAIALLPIEIPTAVIVGAAVLGTLAGGALLAHNWGHMSDDQRWESVGGIVGGIGGGAAGGAVSRGAGLLTDEASADLSAGGSRLVIGGGRAADFPALGENDVSLNIDASANPHILGSVLDRIGSVPSNSYDQVTFEAMWPYEGTNQAQDTYLIQQALRVLKPGGRIYIDNGQVGRLEPFLSEAGFKNVQLRTESYDEYMATHYSQYQHALQIDPARAEAGLAKLQGGALDHRYILEGFKPK